MISYLGLMILVVVGCVFLCKCVGDGVVVNFIGEGGILIGDFYEVFNIVVVWWLLFVLVIENNCYVFLMLVLDQYVVEWLSDCGVGYGMVVVIVDGNDLVIMVVVIDCVFDCV